MSEETMKIKAESIFELVETLQRTGQTAAFLQALKAKNLDYVVVPMDAINTVKDFFAQNRLNETTPFGRTIGITINAVTQRPDPGCQNGHCGHTHDF
ncbi:hypothetical protein [Bradyrhizobium lablabi]|uniref:hypothetical protein n=1 Tax=Bradyrhizobium lablabi TaxID=722472 RepID=UPI00090B2BE5|nr:hypothetical protein [Bradyrhizobium lablabi]SHL47022.1 hypothetical protein SAMN05444321_3002 [Bradyrhizobium lablabi]